MPRKKHPHPRKRLDHDCVFKPSVFQRPDPGLQPVTSPVEQPAPSCHSANHGDNCSACIANARRQYAFDILVMGMEAVVAAEMAKGTYRMLDNIESLLVPPEQVPCMGAEVEVSDTTELADGGVHSRAERREVIQNAMIRGNAQTVREKRTYRKRVSRLVPTKPRKLADGLPVEETIDLTNDSDSHESEEYYWTWDDKCISDDETTSSPIVVADTNNARILVTELQAEYPVIDLTEQEDAVPPAMTVNETVPVKQYAIEKNQKLGLEEGSGSTESDYIDITKEEDGHIPTVFQANPEVDASAEEAKILDVIDTDSEVIINSQIEAALLRSTDDEALESVDEAVDECSELEFMPDASVQRDEATISVWQTTAVKTERKELTGLENSQGKYVDAEYSTKSKKIKKHRREQAERKKWKKEKMEKKREKREKKAMKKEKMEKSNKENYPEINEESEEEQMLKWTTMNKPEPKEGTELRHYGYYQRATTRKMRVKTEPREKKEQRRPLVYLNAAGIKAEPVESQNPEMPIMFSTKQIKLDPEEGWPGWDQQMEESMKYTAKSEPDWAPGGTSHVEKSRGSSAVRIKTEPEERAASAQEGPSTSYEAGINWIEPDVEIIDNSDESCIEIEDNDVKDPDWEPDEDDIEELMDYFELSD